MKKLERDGKIAVLFSPDFGAGWSTWNREYRDLLCFDADIASAVLESDLTKAEAIANEKCPDGYFGGVRNLRIEWIKKGEAFEITEYDGAEAIRFMGQVDFMVA